jgi:phage baseplate assembly protein W
MSLLAWAISNTDAPIPAGSREVLGVGLPLARESKDFRVARLEELVRASITQILGVRADDGRSHGELPWRPDFGSLLHRLQFMNVDETFAALVETRVIGAISQWEPRCRVTRVVVERVDSEGGVRAIVQVHYVIVQAGTSAALSGGQRVDVPIFG